MSAMEADLDTDTRAALSSENTIRCFFKARFEQTSRRSQDVIPWVEQIIALICAATSRAVGQDTCNHPFQLNMVRLLRTDAYAFICYDVFLEGCDEQTRANLSRTLERPMYEIKKRRDVYRIRRSQRLDWIVASRFTDMQSLDHGPLPYFADAENPPIYVDGFRIEETDTDQHIAAAETSHAGES